MAGSNRSGDLADGAKSIPFGKILLFEVIWGHFNFQELFVLLQRHQSHICYLWYCLECVLMVL